jgi:hypothetical protein
MPEALSIVHGRINTAKRRLSPRLRSLMVAPAAGGGCIPVSALGRGAESAGAGGSGVGARA